MSSKDNLSAGMAADILDMYDTTNEKGVKNNGSLLLTVMAVFTLSTFQFLLVVTATKAPKLKLAAYSIHRQANHPSKQTTGPEGKRGVSATLVRYVSSLCKSLRPRIAYLEHINHWL